MVRKDFMTVDEAKNIIKQFNENSQNTMIVDGYTGCFSDKDLIIIAENIQQLKGMAK